MAVHLAITERIQIDDPISSFASDEYNVLQFSRKKGSTGRKSCGRELNTTSDESADDREGASSRITTCDGRAVKANRLYNDYV